jgi:hypothetical protein
MARVPKLAAALGALVVGAGLCACGTREVTPAVTGPTTPGATVPTGPTPGATRSVRHGPPPTATNPPAGSGGTPAPVGRSRGRAAHGREAQADFRKYCETHPGACGD